MMEPFFGVDVAVAARKSTKQELTDKAKRKHAIGKKPAPCRQI
jgi:hypothetical protein